MKIRLPRILAQLLLVILTAGMAFGIGFFATKSITADGEVSLYFVPDSPVLPPNQTLSMMLDAGVEEITFVRVTVNFDQTKVNLSGNITTTPSLATIIIPPTTPATANTTGVATFVVGLTPGDTAPTGIFELAQFPFTTISSTDNDSAILSVDVADSQIVNLAARGYPTRQKKQLHYCHLLSQVCIQKRMSHFLLRMLGT